MNAEEARKIAEAKNNEEPLTSTFLCKVEIMAAAKQGKREWIVPGKISEKTENELLDSGFKISTNTALNQITIQW